LIDSRILQTDQGTPFPERGAFYWLGSRRPVRPSACAAFNAFCTRLRFGVAMTKPELCVFVFWIGARCLLHHLPARREKDLNGWVGLGRTAPTRFGLPRMERQILP